MERTSLTMLILEGECIQVSVRIGDNDYELGSHDTILAAAGAMGKWVRDRGLCWAPDTYARLEHAKRNEVAVLTLDVWTKAERALDLQQRLQAWHQADYYPYIHVAHRMGL